MMILLYAFLVQIMCRKCIRLSYLKLKENRSIYTSKDMGASVRTKVEKMKKKYDRYWGNPDKLNMLLMIALVLHSRYKLQFTQAHYSKFWW